jgi:hypothetical protein
LQCELKLSRREISNGVYYVYKKPRGSSSDFCTTYV